jgi:hypothetical protein
VNNDEESSIIFTSFRIEEVLCKPSIDISIS